jgi:hypothetical protein
MISLKETMLKTRQGLVFLDIGTLYLTVNENYIVLLAGILEQHFEDVVAMIERIKLQK